MRRACCSLAFDSRSEVSRQLSVRRAAEDARIAPESAEIVQTFARGPIVVNERFDRFTMPQRNINWNGIGVFFLTNGAIAEWNDFTIKVG